MSKIIVPLKPIMSEKAYGLSAQRVYMFEVPKDVNKLEVKQAVENQYEVKVDGVRCATLKGEIKRVVRKRGQRITGKLSDSKRAYVTLKEGNKLPIFESVEAEHDHAEDKKPAAKEEKK